MKSNQRSGSPGAFGIGQGGFPDEASQVEGERQDVAQEGGLGGIGQAKTRHPLELSAGLVGIAGFGIGEPSETHLPAGGADLQVTSQADGTIWQSQGGGQAEAQRSGGVLVGTTDRRRIALRCAEIRLAPPGTLLAANPFGALARVVVAVAVQAVAVGTERGAVFIEAAPQAGERIVIPGVMAQLDRAQGFEVLVDEGQDLRIAFACVPQHFSDGETGKAIEQLLEAGDSQQVVVAVGGGEGTSQRPEGEQAVIDDVEGLGFVTKMRLATGFRGRTVILAAGGTGAASGLVGPGVIDIGGLRIASGHQAAVVQAVQAVAIAALFPGGFGGTGTLVRGFEAVGVLVAAAQARTSLDELAVGGDRDPTLLGIPRKGAARGDQPIIHQGFGQAVLTSQQPVRLGVGEGHAQRGSAGQVLGIEPQAAAVALPALGRMQFREQF